MSTLNAAIIIPLNQKGNAGVQYKGVDDATTAAQFALLKAGKMGTDGILNGVLARWGMYGVIQTTDPGGNYHLRVYSDYSGNAADKYKVDSTYGLIDYFGNPGGFKTATVNEILGAPANTSDTAVHAAITMPGAASANGILAATTLTTATQIITAGITNPAGLVPTIAGNDTDMLGPVVLTYTDLKGNAGKSLTLQLNGTTTVQPTLDQIPLGVDTIQKITLPPYTVDASETVVVGTKGLVTVTGFTNLDITRTFRVKGNAAGIVSVASLLVIDSEGTQFVDNLTLNGSTGVSSAKACDKIVSSMLQPQNAGGDTVSIGYSNVLGLSHRMDSDNLLFANFGNVREATRPTVTFDATNLYGNTVLLNSTPDGAKGVLVGYIRCDAPLEFDRF